MRIDGYVSSFPASQWEHCKACFMLSPRGSLLGLTLIVSCAHWWPSYCLALLPCLHPSPSFLDYFPNKLFIPSPCLRICFWMSSNWDVGLSSIVWCDKVPNPSHGPKHLHPVFPTSFVPAAVSLARQYPTTVESCLFQIPSSHRLFELASPELMLLSCVHSLGPQSNVTSSRRFPWSSRLWMFALTLLYFSLMVLTTNKMS